MTAPTDAPPNRELRRGAACMALAALVFASRAWLAHAWGSAVPFWDEWDVEATSLYRPWLAGTLHLGDLFRAHNEHHLLLTRLTDLLFFRTYGYWEPWSQLVLNGALHAAAAAALLALFWSALSRTTRGAFVVGLAVIFTSTCGWQNALLGIQSQVYYSSLLAVGAVAGLLLARRWSIGWWAGWLASIVALYSFAGGVFAAIAVLATMLLEITNRWREPSWWVSVGVVAAVPVLAAILYVEPAGQLPLHARSLSEYYAVIARCLGWPHVNSPWLWVVMQAPLIALLVSSARRGAMTPFERCAVAFVAFSVLQAIAVAHNRGAGLIDHRPLSRYQDPLLLGVAAQWFFALAFATRHGRSGRLLAVAWAAATAIGLVTLTTFNLSVNLPYKRIQDRANLAQVRDYLAHHDATVFMRDPLYPGPHPDPRSVTRVLDDPLLRPVLPKVFFSNQPESAPGMQPWVIAYGPVLFVAALVFFVAILAWPATRMRPVSED